MSALRRKLTAAVQPFADDGEVVAIVDRVMNILVNEPLLVVLSGLSEEVILRTKPKLPPHTHWEGNNILPD